MSNATFNELMAIRDLPLDRSTITISGSDPVLPTGFALGETAAGILAAIGIAVGDIWEQRQGGQQSVEVNVSHAAAALRSYQYLKVAGESTQVNWQAQQRRQLISTPHPTRDGRFFLPHMGLPHLAERILKILKCDYELESVVKAVAGWDALELEDAVASVDACGAMVRTAQEWQASEPGRALQRLPVIEIIKIGNSDPEPLPVGKRPLSGVRALDLTRILAGPTCGRTLAEHGADVLMVTAEHLPQSDRFVMDTSHGKRTCFLDLTQGEQRQMLLGLLDQGDIFSQGYRPGVMERLGLGPEDLHAVRPGIIYTSMNCYGYDGPFAQRAGWEQLAQTVTGICAEQGGDTPRLLPAAACDYSTGYLAAYGTLLALGRRAREGGSYHVRASLCQSGMLLQRQRRVEFGAEHSDIPAASLQDVMMSSDTPFGEMKHLGPVLGLSETPPRWDLPSSPLGTHQPVWLGP